MVTSSPTATTPASQAPLDLVIFGGAGDLSVRKLLPALYMAHLHHNPPEHGPRPPFASGSGRLRR